MGSRVELTEAERSRLAKEARRANRPGIMTELEWDVRKAATAAAHGEILECAESNEPTEAEQCYLNAKESFLSGHQCNGWDAIERGDAICGYDLG
jgi:hypothetical protein